jgi:MFS family permease
MTDHEISPLSKTAPKFYYGYIVVLAAFLMMIAMYGMRLSFGVFFKPMIADFGWSRALTSGAFSVSVLMQGVFGFILGNLNDRLGPRIVMTICGLLLGLGYLLMSQINSAWHLYLFYSVIIGIGMGGAFVPLLSTVARWFVKRRGLMTGIAIAGLGAGNFIMPPVIEWLISNNGWRTTFTICGIGVLIVVVLFAQLLKREPSKIQQIQYPKVNQEEQKPQSIPRGLSLKEATRTLQFWMVFALYICLGFALMSPSIHIVPHATDLGISAAMAASILAVMGMAGIPGGILLGSIADRIGNRKVYIICFILMAIGLSGLVPAKEIWLLFILGALANFGGSGGGTCESTFVAELFGIKEHGSIFGLANMGFVVGAAIGPFILGYIFDITGSYQLAFFLCGAISTAGIILALFLRPINYKMPAQNHNPA